MNPFKYDASFRVRHPEMEPEHISEELGLKAKHQWKAGTARKTPKGEPLKGMYENTYCSFELKHPQNTGLCNLLKQFNHRLYERKEFLKSIRLSGGTLEYFVGWYSDKDSGELFDLELLTQLVELGIDLSIEVYK